MTADTRNRDATGGLSDPYRNSVVVAPSDTVDLPDGTCRALIIGGAGNITYDDAAGNTVSDHPVVAGQEFRVRITRVRVTAVGPATNILACY